MAELKKQSKKRIADRAPVYLFFELDEIKQWLTDNGEKPFRAAQIFEWLYENACLLLKK